MVYDHSYGIVPVRFVDDARRYLLVQHHKGHWGFPKGHAEQGESHTEAARRELTEETGLGSVRVCEDSQMHESYIFTQKSGERVRKTVTYFVGVVEGDQTVTPQPEEIADSRWFSPAEARQTLTFPESRTLLDKAEQYVDKHLT